MSSVLKVTVQGKDRDTLLKLVKQERKNAQKNTIDFNQAQKRAVEFYDDHLQKVQKRLDPNNKYHGIW